MKKNILTGLLCSLSLALWAQPSIQQNSWTQVTTEVCYLQTELVVESIAVYEPNIQSLFTTTNISTFDYTYSSPTFSQNGDTAYVDIDYQGGQVSAGPDSFDVSFSSQNGTSDTVTFNLTVNAEPTVSFNSAGVGYFCNNDDYVDLSPHATPAGGIFEFNDAPNSITPGGIFSPSKLPPNTPTDDIEYIYTDGNGCSGSAYFSWFSYEIPQPTVSVVSNDATDCASGDGSITINASGSTSTFIGSIPTGDSITLSSGVPGSLLNLAPGAYHITVEDDSGCVTTDVANIESGDLSITGTVQDVSCPDASDGSVDITVNSTNNYTLYWEHGVFYEDLTNYPAGTYTVYATDDNGCSVSKTFTIGAPTFSFNEQLTSVSDYDCYDPQNYPSSITVSVNADNTPLSYNFPSGGTMINDSVYEGYVPGDYTVSVTDANGCTIDTTVTVGTYTFFDAYVVDVNDALCGDNTGSIDIDTYVSYPDSLGSSYWNTGATTEDISGLTPGTYTYTMEHVSNPVCNFELDVQVGAQPPQVNDICMVTVDTITTTNLVVWEREQTTGIDHYNIYRETSTAGEFVKIDEVMASEETMFNDVWASPLVKSWSYKISAVNNCGIEGPLSAAHKTVHLRRDLVGSDVELNWNLYEGFTFTQQDLWRYTPSNGWQLIQSFGPTATSYTDTPPTTSGLDYSLEVDPGYTCTSTKATSHNASRSNRSSGVFNPGEGTGASNNSIAENESYSISMYPNPTSELTTMTFDVTQEYNVMISSVNGKVVESIQFTGNRLDVNTSDLSNGIYIITTYTEDKKVVKKLVVQH